MTQPSPDLEVFQALADAAPQIDAAEQVAADIKAEADAKPKLPTTVEELDAEYFAFYDLRVYTTEIVDSGDEYTLTQEDLDEGHTHACFAYVVESKAQYIGSDSSQPERQVGDKVPILFEVEILDVLATHEKIEAAKARAAARRARKYSQVAPDLKDREGDSRQVRRRKERMRLEYKPPTEHVGFNRSSRRGFMAKMPRHFRLSLKKQMKDKAKAEKAEKKNAESLDTAAEV